MSRVRAPSEEGCVPRAHGGDTTPRAAGAHDRRPPSARRRRLHRPPSTGEGAASRLPNPTPHSILDGLPTDPFLPPVALTQGDEPASTRPGCAASPDRCGGGV